MSDQPMSLSAVMTIPRLDFSDGVWCAMECIAKLGIPIRRRGGVFWHVAMTNVIEDTIREDNPKYILTLDQDTVYTPEDVRELYRLMEEHPEAAAIFPVQAGRDRSKIIFTPVGGGRNEVPWQTLEGELVPAASGHFGCTILRVDRLKEMPRPWFHCEPNVVGEWTDDRVDPDAWFWGGIEVTSRALAIPNGWNAFLAPRVVVGHMQLVVTWPDERLEAAHQYIAHYQSGGRPGGVWK